MRNLRARLIQLVPSDEGPQGDIALIEDNDDEYLVRCLCKRNGYTDICGVEADLIYLNERYGQQSVCFAAQGAVLGIP